MRTPALLLEKILEDVYASKYGTKNRVQLIQSLEEVVNLLKK
jgi:hypothetical protein